MVWWNCGGMHSVVGIRNDTMPLRMRTGMLSGMDEIWVASLDLDVCIYSLLCVDVGEMCEKAERRNTILFKG